MRRQSASLIVYRLLLRAYPRPFREAYGPLLEQVFRDILRTEQAHAASRGSLLGLWCWTLGDLARSAFIERTSAMRNDWKWLISLALALAVGLGIGIVDTSPHWDDSGITAMAMLCASGVLGILHPRRPWVWALAIGVWIPILNILATHNPSTIFALIFPFAGAYLGAFGRRLVTRAA